MAAGYDGSITIDTSINAKGFNAGIKAMTTAVKGLAAAMGVALGVAAIFSFGKTAVQAASDMSGALVGLQSVVEGTGGSFSNATKFINNYIADGLVPAMNAMTAYKNLAMRGYDTSQIEKVMIALKDSASFGRQASLSLGQAVQSAAEGLKNENSILVDNAGVTKNVSMMWKDYAASIGTTSNALTKQQKIQAEVNGILYETRFQTGDAAKYSATYAGKVAMLSQVFLNLKIAIGNSIIPILAQMIPYIISAVQWFTVLFNTISKYIQAFFGYDPSANMAAYENATLGAVSATDDLANSTEKAGKTAKGSLAAFDQLNVLQQPETGEGAAEQPAAGAGGIGGIATGEESNIIDEQLSKIQARVDEFKNNMMNIFAPAIDSFNRLKEALAPLGETIWAGLKWAWDNILVPFGSWTISDLLPAFFDLLAAAADVLNQALIALQPLWQQLWEQFLKPAAEWTGQAIIDSLGWITDRLKDLSQWIQDNPGKFREIATIIGIIAASFVIASLAIGAWNLVAGIGTAITTGFGVAMAFLTSPIVLVTLIIIGLIIAIWILIKRWPEISDAASKAWDWIVKTWNDAGKWFMDNVINPIKNGFSSAVTGIQQAWQNAFIGIKTFTKGIINSIIDYLNGMIRSVTGGINSLITGINSLQINIPATLLTPAYVFSSNLPYVVAPQIPRLAAGAVIPPNAEFAAILGDQKSGRNIEAPEDLIRQIIREEMGSSQESGDITVTMPVYLDSEKIYEGQKRVSKRIGKSLLTGVA